MKSIKDIVNFIRTERSEKENRERTRNRPFQEKYDDLGIFTYDDEGFTIKLKESFERILWNEIEKLVAYKMDLGTIDEICLDVVYGEYQITITEETPGWYQFVEKTKEIFPFIAKNWDSTIVYPAFATNLTIIYQRNVDEVK